MNHQPMILSTKPVAVTALPDSRAAVVRLIVALALMTIGNGGMYVVVVVLPVVQAEFGVQRAAASLPYTALMIGFGLGGIMMGRLADRRGVMIPLLIGAASVGAGFIAASMSGRHGAKRTAQREHDDTSNDEQREDQQAGGTGS